MLETLHKNFLVPMNTCLRVCFGSLLKYASKTYNSKQGLHINGLAQLMHRKEVQIKLEFQDGENKEGFEKSPGFLPEKNYSPFQRQTSDTQEKLPHGNRAPFRMWAIGALQ